MLTRCHVFVHGKCKTFLVTGDAGAVGELAALCVKGKQERLAPRLYVHERIQKLSETGVSIITVQHTGVQSSSTSETVRFYTVSYFITPFNQKGISEW